MSGHNAVQNSAQGDHEIQDPGDGGAIPVDKSGVCNLVSVGASETRTLAAPEFIGQRIVFYMDTDGGDIDITSAVQLNQAGKLTMTFDATEESIELIGVTLAGVKVWDYLLAAQLPTVD